MGSETQKQCKKAIELIEINNQKDLLFSKDKKHQPYGTINRSSLNGS
jgi:hypothetical protein